MEVQLKNSPEENSTCVILEAAAAEARGKPALGVSAPAAAAGGGESGGEAQRETAPLCAKSSVVSGVSSSAFETAMRVSSESTNNLIASFDALDKQLLAAAAAGMMIPLRGEGDAAAGAGLKGIAGLSEEALQLRWDCQTVGALVGPPRGAVS
jgi:hypothetical protein